MPKLHLVQTLTLSTGDRSFVWLIYSQASVRHSDF